MPHTHEHLYEIRSGDAEEKAPVLHRPWPSPAGSLPVPGDPTSSTPLGILPPSEVYFFGFFQEVHHFHHFFLLHPVRPIVEGHIDLGEVFVVQVGLCSC